MTSFRNEYNKTIITEDMTASSQGNRCSEHDLMQVSENLCMGEDNIQTGNSHIRPNTNVAISSGNTGIQVLTAQKEVSARVYIEHVSQNRLVYSIERLLPSVGGKCELENWVQKPEHWE